MNENEYLEMAKHFKETYEKLEEQIKEKDKLIVELKKKVFFNYTFSRLIDNYIGTLGIGGLPNHDLKTLVEIQRGQNSMDIDAILGVKDEFSEFEFEIDIDNVDNID